MLVMVLQAVMMCSRYRHDRPLTRRIGRKLQVRPLYLNLFRATCYCKQDGRRRGGGWLVLVGFCLLPLASCLLPLAVMHRLC